MLSWQANIETNSFIAIFKRASIGGFHNSGATTRNNTVSFAAEFVSDFFSELQSVDTMQKRPLINTRDEPHADPRQWRRFHVIIGDTNMSPFATRLKVGATALEVLVANGVDVIVEEGESFTPTPVVSHAILARNRGRSAGLADGIDHAEHDGIAVPELPGVLGDVGTGAGRRLGSGGAGETDEQEQGEQYDHRRAGDEAGRALQRGRRSCDEKHDAEAYEVAGSAPTEGRT